MALHLKSTGIDFADFSDSSATGASTASELLDDYEEGTWTPTGTHVGVATVHQAQFTKIGNVASVQYDITRDAHNDAAQAPGIQQLPFSGGPVENFAMDYMDSNNTHIAANWSGNTVNYYDQGDHITMTRGEIGSKRHRGSWTGRCS